MESMFRSMISTAWSEPRSASWSSTPIRCSPVAVWSSRSSSWTLASFRPASSRASCRSACWRSSRTGAFVRPPPPAGASNTRKAAANLRVPMIGLGYDMPDHAPRRGPWCGLGSIAIAVPLLAVLRFLSTPEGAHWVEDFFRPLGFAAILLGVAGPLLFLGLAGLVLILTIASVVRREPLYLGEVGLTIVVSLFFQAASNHAELWGPYPGR